MKHLSIATLGGMLAVSLTASAQIRHAANDTSATNAGADDAASRSRDRRRCERHRVPPPLGRVDRRVAGEPSAARVSALEARQDDNPGKDVVVLRRYVVTGSPR